MLYATAAIVTGTHSGTKANVLVQMVGSLSPLSPELNLQSLLSAIPKRRLALALLYFSPSQCADPTVDLPFFSAGL